jgi:hypothetical protein
VAAFAGISYRVIANHVTPKNPNQSGRGHLSQVGIAIKYIQRSLLSLACMVMDHHLALDFLLAKQGAGMCHCQYLLLHIYKHFRHCRGMCRLHSPTG